MNESEESNKGPLIKLFGRVGNNGALKETENKQTKKNTLRTWKLVNKEGK